MKLYGEKEGYSCPHQDRRHMSEIILYTPDETSS